MHCSPYIFTLLLFSFTGWITTWVAVKLLFRPRKPVSVFGTKLQGIFPKYQNQFAQKIGQLASKELFSFSGIREKVINPDNLKKLKPEIEIHIDKFLREKLKDSFPMLSMFIGDKTINQLKAAFLMELESLFPILMKSYMDKLEQEIDLEKMITEKIAGYSMEKLETMLNKYTKRQLLYLHLMSACIGLVIGLLYVLINTQVYSQ